MIEMASSTSVTIISEITGADLEPLLGELVEAENDAPRVIAKGSFFGAREIDFVRSCWANAAVDADNISAIEIIRSNIKYTFANRFHGIAAAILPTTGLSHLRPYPSVP